MESNNPLITPLPASRLSEEAMDLVCGFVREFEEDEVMAKALCALSLTSRRWTSSAFRALFADPTRSIKRELSTPTAPWKLLTKYARRPGLGAYATSLDRLVNSIQVSRSHAVHSRIIASPEGLLPFLHTFTASSLRVLSLSEFWYASDWGETITPVDFPGLDTLELLRFTYASGSADFPLRAPKLKHLLLTPSQSSTLDSFSGLLVPSLVTFICRPAGRRLKPPTSPEGFYDGLVEQMDFPYDFFPLLPHLKSLILEITALELAHLQNIWQHCPALEALELKIRFGRSKSGKTRTFAPMSIPTFPASSTPDLSSRLSRWVDFHWNPCLLALNRDQPYNWITSPAAEFARGLDFNAHESKSDDEDDDEVALQHYDAGPSFFRCRDELFPSPSPTSSRPLSPQQKYVDERVDEPRFEQGYEARDVCEEQEDEEFEPWREWETPADIDGADGAWSRFETESE
ncbi:hypothetical protein JCM8547_004579 [Rhodosporidiobolus lusitaniae]